MRLFLCLAIAKDYIMLKAIIRLTDTKNTPGHSVRWLSCLHFYFFIELLPLDYFWASFILHFKILAHKFSSFSWPWSQHMATSSIAWLQFVDEWQESRLLVAPNFPSINKVHSSNLGLTAQLPRSFRIFFGFKQFKEHEVRIVMAFSRVNPLQWLGN